MLCYVYSGNTITYVNTSIPRYIHRYVAMELAHNIMYTHHVWQSQVENEHYSTVCGLIRFVISLECFIEITLDFLCPFMND